MERNELVDLIDKTKEEIQSLKDSIKNKEKEYALEKAEFKADDIVSSITDTNENKYKVLDVDYNHVSDMLFYECEVVESTNKSMIGKNYIIYEKYIKKI